MDFDFTDEQNMVRDGISRLIREEYDFDTRRSVIASESGWRPELWAQLAELGMLAAPFSEEDGGFGGATEAMIIMEEFGKGLAVEPFIPSVETWRQCGAARRIYRRDYFRRDDLCLCLCGTARAL